MPSSASVIFLMSYRPYSENPMKNTKLFDSSKRVTELYRSGYIRGIKDGGRASHAMGELEKELSLWPERMGNILEFLHESEVAESRANLDGDNSETVLAQLRQSAEKILASL